MRSRRAASNSFPVYPISTPLPGESKHYGVRVVGPILDAMGVAHHVIETDADVGVIRTAIDDAYGRGHPVVLFVGGNALP
jgi:hypothetical protein